MPGIERAEFIELFNELYKPVKSYIYYKTGNMDLSEDIVQEAFIKIWEKKEQIKRDSVKQLLFKIAGNLSINRHEHQQVVLKFSSNYKNNNYSVSPEYELEYKQFNEKLQNAIGSLKEKNRIVFLMNRIDGYTYNQIADHLGLTVKAVEKRMQNALNDLKTKIEYKI